MKYIGFVHRDGMASSKQYPDHEIAQGLISQWLSSSAFEAVVWTALPTNYKLERGSEFSVPDAITYLNKLPKSAREKAQEYIARAPDEIQTPLRRALAS